MIWSIVLPDPSAALLEGAVPREEAAPEQRQGHVGSHPDDADDDDRCIDVGEMLIARLQRDEPGDARRRADELGDDQVGPCPAEQDALVAIEIGQYPRND